MGVTFECGAYWRQWIYCFEISNAIPNKLRNKIPPRCPPKYSSEIASHIPSENRGSLEYSLKDTNIMLSCTVVHCRALSRRVGNYNILHNKHKQDFQLQSQYLAELELFLMFEACGG
ncbi:hypothetical protein BGX38DRAFT_227511 [Terfezia claveryi]|nr:hypothetical protein BGX38DRAFT_227511 [Terfezia claveryi]